MISIIISIVNLVAIVILYVLFFAKKNIGIAKDVPDGYTDLLVTNNKGDLEKLSLPTLENAIETKISTALANYTTTEKLTSEYQPKGDYIKNDALTSLKSEITKQIKTALVPYATTAKLTSEYIQKGAIVSLTGRRKSPTGEITDQCKTLIADEDTGGVRAGHGANEGGCILEKNWFNRWEIK